MLEITKQALEGYGALQQTYSPLIKKLMKVINNDLISDRMKATIAVSHIANFASQFRRNIKLSDGTSVPTNAISFVLTGSGAGKDKANRAVEKCFKQAIDKILDERENIAIEEAIKKATYAGEDLPTEPYIYKEYMPPLPPINMSVTTGPGFIQHINDMGKLPLGSTFLYSGEMGDELAYNPDMVENIKILSEIYDLGIREVKYTKGVESRSDAVNGQPVSALFVGSPAPILYDEATKKKLQVAFMSKLARRAFFCYAPEELPEKDFSSEADPIKAMLEYEHKLESQVIEIRNDLSNYFYEVAKVNVKKSGEDIEVPSEVMNIFNIYKRYNAEVINTLINKDSTYALIRRHLQWKALKLAGALTVLHNEDVITVDRYIEAINFCEVLDKDMEMFEYDLNKSYYEKFSDYIRSKVGMDKKASLSIHDIKKKGFLSSVTKAKLKELITLCAAYDKSGLYTIVDEDTAIQYEPVIKTEELVVSYKKVDNTALNKAIESGDKEAITKAKHMIAANTAYGFSAVTTTFEYLKELLSGDFAYTPFELDNGVRGRDKIIGGTKWVVIDVDDTPITAKEMHLMLSDINHHIALTSDPNNPYKYRILLELDAEVTLNANEWGHFIRHITESLAIDADILPQSQIFFSYAGRDIYSNIDGEPIATRDYVMSAIESAQNKQPLKVEALSEKQRKALLDDKLTTFIYAFEAPYGSASREVARAMYHLRRLGGSYDEAIELFDDIQKYWADPFPDDRQDRFKEQIRGIFNE